MPTRHDDERSGPGREGGDSGVEAVCPVCDVAGSEAGLARHLRHEHGWETDRIGETVDESVGERTDPREPR